VLHKKLKIDEPKDVSVTMRVAPVERTASFLQAAPGRIQATLIATPSFLAFAKKMNPKTGLRAVSFSGRYSAQKKFQEILHQGARVATWLLSFGRCCVLKLGRQR
jgi:hypothetical protein